MACEGFYSILTPSTKHYEDRQPAHSLSSCSFPACLKPSIVRHPRPISALASRSKSAGLGKKTKKKVKDDPWESLFKQLEKDLENDTEDTRENEITEEDLTNFERELDMVVEELANVSNAGTMSEPDDTLRGQSIDTVRDDGESDNDDKEGIKAKSADKNEGVDDGNEDKDDDRGTEVDDEYFSDDDFEEPRKVPLQPWQLRKLAAAVELGRRKVHIKSLAAELQLEREDVLSFIKNPPPELLMAASQLEEARREDGESVSDEEDISSDEGEADDSLLLKDADADQPKDDGLSHELKRRTYGPRDWGKGKRLKKVTLATLQRVYKKTKRPTNIMIESVVRATNLPRLRVLGWFEEERARLGTSEPPRQSTDARRAWKRPVTHSFERLE